MSKYTKFKSTWSKRHQLVNAVLDSDYNGSTDQWLAEKNMDFHDLTDSEIDKMIWMLNALKEDKVKA